MPDIVDALLFKSWADPAFERAQKTGNKVYIVLGGSPYRLSDEKPDRASLVAEVYPGDRIIKWQ